MECNEQSDQAWRPNKRRREEFFEKSPVPESNMFDPMRDLMSGDMDVNWEYWTSSMPNEPASDLYPSMVPRGPSSMSSYSQVNAQPWKDADVGLGNPETVQAQEHRETHLCCFGMVRGLAGTCKFPAKGPSDRHKICLDGNDGQFQGVDQQMPQGSISPGSVHIVAALSAEKELVLEMTCRKDPTKPTKPTRPGQLNGSMPSIRKCLVDIIIYGPPSYFEEVGSFFEDHDIHLQDPEDCQLDLPYQNPHKLPNQDGKTMLTSESKRRTDQVLIIEEEQRGADLLDTLNSQQDLAETEQPPSIRTKLQRHQLQALTFMLHREQGWAWDGSKADIWEFCEDGTESYFINRISNAVQTEEPPQFYGGIIADPMGLGKTLSMIGLIAYDIAVDRSNPSTLTGAGAVDSSEQTLIVVPAPLLIEWDRQLQEHIIPGSLPWLYHHGKSRLSATDLRSGMIVLTTYHKVSLEWKHQDTRANSVIFNTQWKRVILDEAHFIRNSESQMARAICSIDSVSRWAITGTPIQNKLADLATLLKFLHVYPYSERRAFEEDFSYMWKSGGSDEAIRRLQRLAGCILLRRPKNTIELPPRQDLQFFVDMTLSERSLYDEIRTQTAYQIEQAIRMRDQLGSTYSYQNVLQRIEAMRMVCNLGLYYHSRHQTTHYGRPQNESWGQIAQKTFNMRREMDPISCRFCSHLADGMDDTGDEQVGSAMALFSSCWEFTCSVCAGSNANANKCSAHTPSCHVAAVSVTAVDTSEMLDIQGMNQAISLPTKVSLLLQDLQAQPLETKCVVFSTWRTTLDIIELGLKVASISHLRFDGKVPQKDRQGIVERFRRDPSVKVLMLTLACGAAGLTLTEATRAYLMEPNWNPTVEDQALARIHRIGQTKPVTTVRFIVRETFEERVVELQKTKRDLAAILLSRHGGENVQLDMSTRSLELLRGLI